MLDRYRPLRPLGRGGSGSVWLARDERTGLEIALKIVPREGKRAARAMREMEAASRLRHERCVRAYDFAGDEGHVYIAYEYVRGRTLREAIRRGELDDAAAVEAAAQVLEGLAHAHRRGIVHRDVKPSNVLLEDTSEVAVRVLDFGLAQFDDADTLTAVGDVPGTLAYIAPERLDGQEATVRSDVWAVGVMIWEALAGTHPFWGVPLPEVASAIAAGPPPLSTRRGDLPRRLLTAIDGALAVDPARRPTASQLAAELREAFVAPRPPATKRRPPGGGRRRLRAPAPLRCPSRSSGDSSAGLAVVATAVGGSLLPFWPGPVLALIALTAGLGALRSPRLGMAIALAAPVLPIGNVAQAAAVVYAVLAAAWLAVAWRDARAGLLFTAGPLLAPLGLLALLPLAVQPARGAWRRALHAAMGVLVAAAVTGLAGGRWRSRARPSAIWESRERSGRRTCCTRCRRCSGPTRRLPRLHSPSRSSPRSCHGRSHGDSGASPGSACCRSAWSCSGRRPSHGSASCSGPGCCAASWPLARGSPTSFGGVAAKLDRGRLPAE